MTLEEARAVIDDCDARISALLVRRMEACDAIATVKKQTGAGVYAKERENAVLARVSQLVGQNCEDDVRAIYQTIFARSKARQERLIVGHYALLGQSLIHSYSKLVHESLFPYAYDLLPLPPQTLGEQLQSGAYDGYNVTIPYKQAVIPHCARLTDAARAIGAVNTLIKTDEGLLGDNTDADGMTDMLAAAGIDIDGKNVLILGSGGTSRTARYVLSRLRARHIDVVSRSGEINYENVYDHAHAQVILNATPVGMYPDVEGCPVDIRRFLRLEAVVDVIYHPQKTCLLHDAEALGIKTAGGMTMLVRQAVKSGVLFGQSAPSEERVRALLARLEDEMP